ncbi:uncharacterized protein LOC110719183 [Chenopodium quinoa]|uniref:uncharacterized protein LOC110719183 n=1 Tax=Chenopodium quinoa TaxID=63459 RepID=UPI000B788163|nr:uncharacterized protein LOC110719183 [Chenopodium quinoa]
MMDLDSEDGSVADDDEEDNAEHTDEEDDEANPTAQRLNQIEAHNAKLLRLLKRLPRAPVQTVTEEPEGFAASPFVDKIAMADIPRRLSIPPPAKLYDGSTCPLEHVTHCKQRMWFYSKFNNSCKVEKQTSDLYRVMQRNGETIKSYFGRFNKEMIGIKNYDVRMAIEAFKRGLFLESKLYKEFTKYLCITFKEVRTWALAQIRLEEDLATRKGVKSNDASNSEKVDKRTPNSKKNWRRKPYDRLDQVNNINNVDDTDHVQPVVNDRSGKSDADAYPKIAEYGFCVDIGGAVNALHSLGAVARWSEKSDKPLESKDQSKWCDYHSDQGHRTKDCNTLRHEVAFLINKGHLKELIGKGKMSNKEALAQQPSKGPNVTKVVNVISGGSDIYGLTYSAAKKIARTGTPEEATPKDVISRKDVIFRQDKALEAMTISFDDCDLGEYREEHHDGLVIYLTIGNFLLR